MMLIHEQFKTADPEIETIVQSPTMSDDERSVFIERFAAGNAETLVGFAVMGGLFSEGIDLVGDRLTGAVIAGIGLPGVCPERNLIRDYYEQRNGLGFEFAYLYPGINRVLQAAGRVIRSEKDKGVILLIDERFVQHRIQSLFPKKWSPVHVLTVDDVGKRVYSFWNKK